ncbi:SufE family protein [Tropheryma whipplei]|uniref:Fe-S metabolism associated domain-containing protein n=1 Tax=Tropheryma whipplei (strain Twist) TaxID=203267 RepID=Q83GC1_TROWT|nr:SufE family protein [Tropheryma whipplei]AAO44488.1 unknown [Tropheryma whipplei str. Twist]MCO8182348.1 SufE family protein [Tropheryma whipplei]MCO8190118.1 SufE family protein [Tropheryma whipplei]CAD67050.1 conserved hypothetical protein [Tropheryma whipplei TW08/27]
MTSALEKIRDDFIAIPEGERLNLLLYFSDSLPPLPDHASSLVNREVPECQSPLSFLLEVKENRVYIWAYAPKEAPTTRGFASIVVQGIYGETVENALGVPSDFPLTLGLTRLVSPLRLRGMSAFIARVKAML